MADPRALHGDGINFAFFNLLWSKSDDGAKQVVEPSSAGQEGKAGKTSSILRVPDTVVFLFGQPHEWYFTSKNGGPHKNKTTILRKKRVNLTVANIEEVFLTKSASRDVGEDDVVAYFISSKADGTEQLASLDACNAVAAEDATSCNIEYLNNQALKEFLQHGRNNKSGILQRFIAPHGGDRHNSQIRAIWTPKLCILERRRTKQDLHDTRFALYERCITFDGPDVHSVSVPLRGTVLSGQVENICKDIVEHLAHVAVENARAGSKVSSTGKKCTENTFVRVARMVVNFKVDGNGKVWILWSNSIRLESVAVESRMKLTESDVHSLTQVVPSRPLNMDAVVRLPSSIKLTQAPNHSVNTSLENKLLTATCPSCHKHDADLHFQPVPYKTVMQHFEKTLKMLEEDDDSHPSKVWPPEDRFIKSAGDVGFGSLPAQLARDRETNPSRRYSKETHKIPPVIREIHPGLRVKGYSVYRNDPLFLHKTASVCETCFLSYAQLTSTSFVQLTARPVEPYGSDKGGVRYNFPDCDNNKAQEVGIKKNPVRAAKAVCNTDDKDFGCVQPELPPAIMEPQQVNDHETVNPMPRIPPEHTPPKPKDSLFNTLPTYFPVGSEKNLGHLIASHKMLAEARGSGKPRAETYKNPYKEKLVL